MKEAYFSPDKKLGPIEELVFNHYLDEDIMMIRRDGVSADFVRIAALLIMLVLALIAF